MATAINLRLNSSDFTIKDKEARSDIETLKSTKQDKIEIEEGSKLSLNDNTLSIDLSDYITNTSINEEINDTKTELNSSIYNLKSIVDKNFSILETLLADLNIYDNIDNFKDDIPDISQYKSKFETIEKSISDTKEELLEKINSIETELENKDTELNDKLEEYSTKYESNLTTIKSYLAALQTEMFGEVYSVEEDVGKISSSRSRLDKIGTRVNTIWSYLVSSGQIKEITGTTDEDDVTKKDQEDSSVDDETLADISFNEEDWTTGDNTVEV